MKEMATDSRHLLLTCERFKRENTRLKKELEDVIELRKENDYLKQQNVKLKSEMATLTALEKEETFQQSNAVNSLAAENMKLQSEINDLHQEIDELRTEIAAKLREISELRTANSILGVHVDTLSSSSAHKIDDKSGAAPPELNTSTYASESEGIVADVDVPSRPPPFKKDSKPVGASPSCSYTSESDAESDVDVPSYPSSFKNDTDSVADGELSSCLYTSESENESVADVPSCSSPIKNDDKLVTVRALSSCSYTSESDAEPESESDVDDADPSFPSSFESDTLAALEKKMAKLQLKEKEERNDVVDTHVISCPSFKNDAESVATREPSSCLYSDESDGESIVADASCPSSFSSDIESETNFGLYNPEFF